MTPETPTTETPKTPEKVLTPEQQQEQILDEVLKRYGVDLKSYHIEKTKSDLAFFRQDIETTPEELSLEQKAKELYEKYMQEELGKENGIENTANIDTLTENINSQRISDLKEEFEKVIDPDLDKYDFLDDRTKKFIKLGFMNSLLKSPMAKIGDSLMGGIADFVGKLQKMDSGDINSIINAFKEAPKDSGRSLAFEDQFIESLKLYTDKFNEIQEKLKTKPELTHAQKQNIISHIDWFRDPALIEAGVNGLDVSKLNLENKNTKNDDIDKEELLKYMTNSREKIFELSKKLNFGDKVGDNLYNIINSGGAIGEGVQKIAEFILKIPFIGKFFAIFLGLNPDPDKAIVELKENSQNFKILSGFKSLGMSKNKEGKHKDGIGHFRNIDLGEINFNSSKKEIVALKPFIESSEDDEKIKEFWLKAFGKGVEKDLITLKFKMTAKQKEDKKIDSLEFKKIIKTGLDDYNTQKEKKRVKEEATKRDNEKEKKEKNLSNLGVEITALTTSIETISFQIKGIDSILTKDYEKINHWDDILNIGDINNIKTQDIINHKGEDFGDIIGNIIGKNDYKKDLIPDDKKILNQMFSLIRGYCKENKLSNQGELKDFLKNNETGFNTWLKEKKKKLEEEKAGKKTEKTGKEKEQANLTGNIEKYNFAENIGKKLNAINTETKLSDGIEVGDGEKTTTIKLENNQLRIGEENFEMYGIDATITDIVIDGSDKVTFVGERRFLSGSEPVPKESFISGLKDLVLKGSYNFTTIKGKNIKVEKV